MPGDFHRSLNLAQAAAVGLYEALRQIQGWS
jgi:tRNA (cytidine/uridine-2'-O-)-methyltransferase